MCKHLSERHFTTRSPLCTIVCLTPCGVHLLPSLPADTLIMYQVPSSSDVAGRRALRRLQEVSSA